MCIRDSAEGAQVQLRAAPQLLDGAAGLSQILGKIRPFLIRALAQFLFVGLQSQRAAALVGLILEEDVYKRQDIS